MALISALLSLRSVFSCSLHKEQHLSKQRLIFTSPDCQSTSGLCFCNHGKPSSKSCFPSDVTAKEVHSEWDWWQRTISSTSVIDPASFAVPSTLKTGMG